MAPTFPSDTRRWWVVGLLFLAILISYIDRSNLSIAAVPIMHDLGLSSAAMGTLLSAFFWTYAIFQLPAGSLVDRWSVKWLYGVAFLVWSLASAATGFATSFGQILVLRLLLGLGEAVATPVSLSYIRNHFPADQRGLATGVYVSGMMLGPAFGTLLGGLALARFSWRYVFVLTGVGGCLWLVPWFALASGRDVSHSTRSQHQAASTGWKRILALPTFWAITLGAFSYSYYWYFFLTWLPSYLIMQRGLDFVMTGAYTALPLIAMAASAPLGGRWADRFESHCEGALRARKVFTAGGFLLGSSVLLSVGVHSAPALLALLVFSTAGLGLATANYWTITQQFAPPDLVGRFIGYQNMVASLAGICAPALTGLIVDRTKNFDAPLLLAGAALVIAAAVYMVFVRHTDIRVARQHFPLTFRLTR